MTRELLEIKKKMNEIDYSSEKLGEMFFDVFNGDMNFTTDMGKSLSLCIDACNTSHEYDLVNRTVIGLCGESIETLLEKIEKRDADGYIWESL